MAVSPDGIWVLVGGFVLGAVLHAHSCWRLDIFGENFRGRRILISPPPPRTLSIFTMCDLLGVHVTSADWANNRLAAARPRPVNAMAIPATTMIGRHPFYHS